MVARGENTLRDVVNEVIHTFSFISHPLSAISDIMPIILAVMANAGI